MAEKTECRCSTTTRDPEAQRQPSRGPCCCGPTCPCERCTCGGCSCSAGCACRDCPCP